ncbi:UPF0057 membrane protein [Vanrija pseudolonga]|uniref:UPF0057 membrane protein n=1 Tax=Vanrija pseudolonga TaxID=143232 RepID=A0AAF1BLQ1_9TREE|nr:UPF0057 membrane protein [Vanrija pseudolonga]
MPSNSTSTFIEMDTKPPYNGNNEPAQERENRPTPSPAQRGATAHSPPPCPSPSLSMDEWSTTTELTSSSLASPNPVADIWLYVLAFFIPPLAVALRVGCGFEVFLDIILWILCWIPGVIYAFYIIASRPGHL